MNRTIIQKKQLAVSSSPVETHQTLPQLCSGRKATEATTDAPLYKFANMSWVRIVWNEEETNILFEVNNVLSSLSI